MYCLTRTGLILRMAAASAVVIKPTNKRMYLAIAGSVNGLRVGKMFVWRSEKNAQATAGRFPTSLRINEKIRNCPSPRCNGWSAAVGEAPAAASSLTVVRWTASERPHLRYGCGWSFGHSRAPSPHQTGRGRAAVTAPWSGTSGDRQGRASLGHHCWTASGVSRRRSRVRFFSIRCR